MGINFWGWVYGVKYFALLKKEPRAQTREYFECIWDCRAGRPERVFGEQVAVRGFTEALAPTNWRIPLYLFPACILEGFARRSRGRARLGANTPPASRDEAVARFDRLTPTMPDAAAAADSAGRRAARAAHFDWARCARN